MDENVWTDRVKTEEVSRGLKSGRNILHRVKQMESILHTAVMCIYLYIHAVMNTTILQLVAIYNIQLHVSALYLGCHQVAQRTY